MSFNIPAKAGPDLTGYKLIFDDEFDGTTLDLSKWQIGTTPAGQQWGSDSYFVTSKPEDAKLFPEVYIVRDGVLTIRANYQPDFVDPNKWGRKWYSGMITTAFADGRPPSAAFRRGYVEIRQKLPSGKGVWPANWSCNLKSQSPQGDPLGVVELDGIEAYGVNMTVVHTTVHHWVVPKAATTVMVQNLPDLTADFHVYGYLVGDKDLETYLDGALIAKVPLFRANDIDPFFWMFNLAMGGGWPIDVPASGHYDMQIDYIRIYSKDQTATSVKLN
ncbi:MAG: glycoside hydrolase family 16 protein [Alphaproteobacteria bacterium]|nr:glycoside hydrolase family 16 protein [Alphaproteobacteria bacterium]